MRNANAPSPRHPKVPPSLPRRHALAAVAASLFALPVMPAKAATIHVDGSTCTLGQAIDNAKYDTSGGGCIAGSGADTLNLLADITLTSRLPDLFTDITIEGNGRTVRRDPSSPDLFGIFFVGNGPFTLNQTTVTGGLGNRNTNSGGIVAYGGPIRVTRSTISGNVGRVGGGIACFGQGGNYAFTLSVENSLVSGNRALYGGGIGLFSDCSATINNSTISGNNGSPGGVFVGAGYYAGSKVDITDSTITGNGTIGSLAGGLVVDGGSATLSRTIISGNRGNRIQEIEVGGGGTVTAVGNNLFGHSGLSNAQAFQNFNPGASDINATSDGTLPTALADILDTTLDDNGGLTQTHALFAGSPAVGAAGTSCSPTDQRGVSRPQGSACDIGAYELVAMPTTLKAQALVRVKLGLSGAVASVAYEATLKRQSGPLAGASVRFVTAGKPPCTATTDAKGVARCGVSVSGLLTTLFTGSFKAHFDGDTLNAPSVTTGQFLRVN